MKSQKQHVDDCIHYANISSQKENDKTYETAAQFYIVFVNPPSLSRISLNISSSILRYQTLPPLQCTISETVEMVERVACSIPWGGSRSSVALNSYACQRRVRVCKPGSAYASYSYGVFTSGSAVGHRYFIRGFGVPRQGVHLGGTRKVTMSRVSTTELRVSPHKPSPQKYRVTAILDPRLPSFFFLFSVCRLQRSLDMCRWTTR